MFVDMMANMAVEAVVQVGNRARDWENDSTVVKKERHCVVQRCWETFAEVPVVVVAVVVAAADVVAADVAAAAVVVVVVVAAVVDAVVVAVVVVGVDATDKVEIVIPLKLMDMKGHS